MMEAKCLFFAYSIALMILSAYFFGYARGLRHSGKIHNHIVEVYKRIINGYKEIIKGYIETIEEDNIKMDKE